MWHRFKCFTSWCRPERRWWRRRSLLPKTAPADVVSGRADQYTAVAEIAGETIEEKRRRILLTMELAGSHGTQRGLEIEAELAKLNKPKFDRIGRPRDQ